ncbi:hypothetical protein [Paraliobacillus zengyii]|uniref:hypothetical protein n=1 Tax=Paraliobacillus zengyii TaxID=2213194 RepID=UPI0013006205|nr:hypothetical protein [Paraliobacillus zengyii]
MTKRKKNYLQGLLILIILVLMIYTLDLPKVSSFITIGVVTVVNVLFFELFIFRDKNTN